MAGHVLEWFRDEDGWTTPKGRRGEFVALAVGFPVFLWFVTTGPGLPQFAEQWPVAILGAVCGFCYVVYYRERILARLSFDFSSWTLFSLLGSGFGLSVLESVPATNAIVTGLLALFGTIVAIYLLWLISPVHDGLQPPGRGVEPPSAVDVDG